MREREKKKEKKDALMVSAVAKKRSLESIPDFDVWTRAGTLIRVMNALNYASRAEEWQ